LKTRRLLKIFLLFLAFSVEIHVKALDLALSPGCTKDSLGKSKECFAMNGLSPGQQKINDLNVFYQSRSVFSVSGSLIKWVQGEGAVQAPKGVEIETTFGSALCEKDCVGAFEKKEDRLEFHALKGKWQVLSFAQKNRQPLLEGSSLALFQVGEKGLSDWGIARSLSSSELKHLFSKVFLNALSSRERAEITTSWKKAVSALSGLYQSQAQRAVASRKASEEREKARQLREEREDRALREMFRRKNLLD